jgi:hypothetical protein
VLRLRKNSCVACRPLGFLTGYSVHGCGCPIRAALSVRCSRSSMPFAWGWYAVVRIRSVPMSSVNFLKSADSKFFLRSVVMTEGHP